MTAGTEPLRGLDPRLATRGRPGRAIRALVAAAGTLVLLAGCRASTPGRSAASVPPLLVAPHPSVVAVMASGGGLGEVSTGFFVASGLVVTSGHGVEGRNRISIRFPEGVRFPSHGLLAESRAHDLATLDVGGEVAAPALRLSDRPPRAGDSLRVVWARNSRTQRTDRAVVVRGESFVPPWGEVFEIRAPLDLGCSGAPVLDEHDRVVGVVVAGDPERATFYAVPERFVGALATGLATGSPAGSASAVPAPDPRGPR